MRPTESVHVSVSREGTVFLNHQESIRISTTRRLAQSIGSCRSESLSMQPQGISGQYQDWEVWFVGGFSWSRSPAPGRRFDGLPVRSREAEWLTGAGGILRIQAIDVRGYVQGRRDADYAQINPPRTPPRIFDRRNCIPGLVAGHDPHRSRNLDRNYDLQHLLLPNQYRA